MKRSFMKVLSLLAIVAIILSSVSIIFVNATENFSMIADTIAVQQGETGEIIVPVKITSIPSDMSIACLSVNFVVDASKLLFQSVTSGPMIVDAAKDIDMGSEPSSNGSQGKLLYMFTTTTDADYLDSVKVEEGNVYVNLKYKLAPNVKAGTYPIKIEPAAAVSDSDANTLISATDLANCLIAGAIVVQGDAPVTHSITFKADGNVIATKNVNDGETLALTDIPSVPVKAGYTGVWDKTSFANITSDLTVNAVYTESTTEYKITSVNSVSPITVAYGTSWRYVDLPDNVTVKVNKTATRSLEVTWEQPDNYRNGNKADAYTVIGTVDPDDLDVDASLLTNGKFEITTTVTVKKQTGTGTSYGSDPVDGNTTYKPMIKFKLNDYSFTLDNAVKPMDAPFIYNDEGDRSMAPVRFIAQALGYDVNWDNVSKATITNGKRTVILEISSEIMLVDGAQVKMDTAPIIRYDRTYIPVRFIANAFGLTVGWDATTQQTTLN